MFALFFAVFTIFLISGCSHVDRKGVMSQELPLTVGDLSEIREGEENHKQVVLQHRLYYQPTITNYLNQIAANIANVSTRPSLPYQVFLLDEDEVNIFGGPGGYIYITRGLLQFIQSEAELAGIIAHEIGHISHYDYADLPQHSRIKLFYKGLLKGSELARDGIGTYGSAVHYGIKGIGRAAPYVARHFNKDSEVVADEKAVEYLLKAGYDPRPFRKFVEKLARVKTSEIPRFVLLMNTHPPFQDRRTILTEKFQEIDFENGSIEFRQDALSEMTAAIITTGREKEMEEEAKKDITGSMIFEPELGVRRLDPVELGQIQRDKDEKWAPMRGKRFDWL